MPKCPHTTFTRGKRVLVRLKDGTRFVDRFHDNNHTQVLFKGHTVARSLIKSISIYREYLDSRST